MLRVQPPSATPNFPKNNLHRMLAFGVNYLKAVYPK
jgi:hypothetical protein